MKTEYTETPLRVLLVGAAGVFGSRLAHGLARESGLKLILAGRRRAPLLRLARRLPVSSDGEVEVSVVDRTSASSSELARLRPGLVIDAAGPFQSSNTALLEAAIDCGCHYLDLSDARDFISRISQFDVRARLAGVVCLSGASTTPGLTHPVIESLTRGWKRIDILRVGIAPANDVPRGLALVRAILSWAGQPVRMFRDGAWTEARGFGLTRAIEYPGLGRRASSLCETADLDLLVSRFRPRVAAEFYASLELPLIHHGLALAALMVRFKLLRSLVPLARPLRFAAGLLRPFGSDRGGMVVEAIGQDMTGAPRSARWSLVAPHASGPFVPTLAALAMTRRVRDGNLPPAGASACAGTLRLDEFAHDLKRLGLTTESHSEPLPRSAFQVALGERMDQLPAITRRIHEPDPVLLMEGCADVQGAETWIGSWVARAFGFPAPGHDVPLRVVVEAMRNGDERWSRIYPTRTMSSTMAHPDPCTHTIGEQLGGFEYRLALVPQSNGIALEPLASSWHGFALPQWLLPRVEATERASSDRHRFDVSIAMPLLGRLVRYRGRLKVCQP